MKNFKNLLIVLLLACFVACTVSSVSAASKVVEKNSDMSYIIVEEDVPLSIPTDLIEGKLEKDNEKDGNIAKATYDTHPWEEGERLPPVPDILIHAPKGVLLVAIKGEEAVKCVVKSADPIDIDDYRDLADEMVPLSVPTDLMEGKLEKDSGKDGNTAKATYDTHPWEEGERLPPMPDWL